MPNELTGDFDAVAQFTVSAADRILAAMHRADRFPHSKSVRVDTRPVDAPLATLFVPSMFSVVSKDGSPVADAGRVVAAARLAESIAAARPAGGGPWTTATPVNVDWRPLDRGPLQLAQTTGTADVQLSPPRLVLHPGSDTRLTAVTEMMVRYFPEPGSRPLPRFLRGQVRTTGEVDRLVSQAGTVLEVNLTAAGTDVLFDVAFSGPEPIAGHESAIRDAVRKAVTTGFTPSTATLPPGREMSFKTFPGAPPIIGILLGSAGAGGDPASAAAVLLGGDDDFAFAAGRDYVRGAFQQLVTERFQLPRTRVVRSTLADYTVTLSSAEVDLGPGHVLLVVRGSATTDSVFPNFSFTVRQHLGFQLASGTPQLVALGDPSLEVHGGGVAGWIISLFQGTVVANIRAERDHLLAAPKTREQVAVMLSAERNLGQFLAALMNPKGPAAAAEPAPAPELAYTSVEIEPAGLLFHGQLSVAAWPAPRVDFEQGSWTSGSGTHEFTALKSWIPGGTIRKYTWTLAGRPQPLHVDANTFVYADTPTEGALEKASPFVFDAHAALEAARAEGAEPRTPSVWYGALCLTIEGTRLSSSGPVVEEPVRATRCGAALGALPVFPVSPDSELPALAIARETSDGRGSEVIGHAGPVQTAAPGGPPPVNLLVYFARAGEQEEIDTFEAAARRAGRADAATAFVVVAPAEALRRLQPRAGVIVTDDPAGAWRRTFDVGAGPAVVLVHPSGEVAWRHEGESPPERLAAELRARLARAPLLEPVLSRPAVALGQLPPNFAFSHAPGRDLTLHKLAGRPVVLVFWKVASAPSLDMLRRVSGRVPEQTLVLAVNDGDPRERAERAMAAGGPRAVLVPDPRRAISRAYGITAWPTLVFLDAGGRVQEVRFGAFDPDDGRAARGEPAAAS